jgi:hypothetical protein
METEILERKLREIDRRRAEIEIELPRHNDGSYARQELVSEAKELAALRVVVDRRLRALSQPAPAPDPRRQAIVAQEIGARRESIEHFIKRLEAEGDHRQARLWRRQLLDLPEQVESEYHG